MRNLLTLMLIFVAGGVAAFGFVAWRSMQGEAQTRIESEYFLSTDRYVVVAGATIRLREEGAPSNPPILLIHGFTHSLETWDEWARALKDEYRVLRYDLLGHGLSGPDPLQRYSPVQRAQFIGELLDTLGVERVSIAGNSLGGLAAWRFAAMRPDRVDRLILISPGAYPLNGVSDVPATIPPVMKAYLLTATEPAVAASAKLIYADDSRITPERVAVMRTMMRREGNGKAMIQSLEQFTLPDPTPDLAKITSPTLIQWGEDDMLIPVAQGRRLEGAIANARLITYAGVGHAAQEEAPAQTVADALIFLSERADAQDTP